MIALTFFTFAAKKVFFCFTQIITEVKFKMASEKIKAGKQQIVAELSEKLKTASAGVIVNYAGITVEDDTKLRAELRKAGVEYAVVKNTMTKRAVEAVGYGKLGEVLEGMTAIAISQNDPVAAAKIMKDYAEKVESFDIKAGFVDGEVLDRDGVMALANIPSKETLIGKILGSIQSPLYGLAYALQAIVDKSGEAPAEAAEATEAAE